MLKGSHHTEEAKGLIAESNRLRRCSDETRARIGAGTKRTAADRHRLVKARRALDQKLRVHFVELDALGLSHLVSDELMRLVDEARL